MTIPAGLLADIASPEGGRVELVSGAGCSFDWPTELPLSKECALEAHRKLVADGFLEEGECKTPTDLSALANLVQDKDGGSQRELIRRLPVTKFKTAKPNEGHCITAALLIERVISNVITLNFDLAFSHALAQIGAGHVVSVISGPEQHDQLSQVNLVYLHRNIDANPEHIVLTTEALETAWQDGWEEMIVHRILTSPSTIFAGMGSSCGVFRESGARMKNALGDAAKLYFVNPEPNNESDFVAEMQIEDENYIQLGWIEFMRSIGARFHEDCVNNVVSKCSEISQREEWVNPETGEPLEDIYSIERKLRSLDILAFGKARARWLLDSRNYRKIEHTQIVSIADLLLAVGLIERTSGGIAELDNSGHITLTFDGRSSVRIFLVDGSESNYRWLSLDGEIKKLQQSLSKDPYERPSCRILTCGITGGLKPSEIDAPDSIINGNIEEGDIVLGEFQNRYFGVHELRDEPELAQELVS